MNTIFIIKGRQSHSVVPCQSLGLPSDNGQLTQEVTSTKASGWMGVLYSENVHFLHLFLKPFIIPKQFFFQYWGVMWW